ncbi:MAG TPA: FtsX-like permease family protein [Puia sp.]|nr:FtsX-like permease family protein [Puia sp.]
MLRTHLKLALRNFRKYPAFSLINLGGLATGIAASFVLLIYSRREMNCDRHFQDSDKIYRVATDFFNMGGFAKSQPMLRDLLHISCKDVEYATALDRSYQDVLMRVSEQERAFTGNYPYYTDPSFFKVFSFQTASGAIPENGLQPGEIILSESYARKFFGTRDAIGKTLLIGKESTPAKVVAVLKEDFQKSHLDPQIVLPMTPDKTSETINWSSAAVYNYVKLKGNGSESGLKSWLDRLLEKVVYPASGANTPFAQWRQSNSAVKFIVQPLTSIYFNSDLKFEISAGGNFTQVKILGGLSIFLILLAIINYVNLVTARYTIRAREIGVKKTFGASRMALASQMIQESLLFSLLAMILACGLIQVILFVYHRATGSALTGPMPLTAAHYGGLVLFSLSVGLLAGIYPAFYLTAFRPIISLRAKGKLPGKGNPRVRNALVLVQFIIAAGLIFVSIVVYGQLQYMKNKDKGFRAEGVVLVENVGSLEKQASAFQQAVEKQAQVVSTSFCERTPAGKSIWMYTYRTTAMKEDMTLQTFPVDDKYIPTMGMHLTNGRNFRRDLITDTNSLILNESAVAALGLFNPVGATINGSERVIGVVKDFNFASLRQKIGPVVLKYSPTGSYLAIRISGGHAAAFLDRLNEIGKGFTSGEPLRLSFLDDNFAQLAEKERLLGRAINFFTILAILLATGGLIGLTLFNIEQRTREIGIRKVLGAGVQNILGLVSRDFIRLVALASLIALPLSWWVMNRWLENFAFRVPIGFWTFFITEAVTVSIAMSVICILSFRAAIASPVENLRSE